MANQVLKGALHFPCMIIQNDQTGKGNQGNMQVAFSAKKAGLESRQYATGSWQLQKVHIELLSAYCLLPTVLLLLMSVFSQTLFTLMRSHLMSFSFLSAGHRCVVLINC